MPKSPRAETLVEDLVETLSPSDGVTYTIEMPRPWAATGVHSPPWSPRAGRPVRPVRVCFLVPDQAQVDIPPRNQHE